MIGHIIQRVEKNVSPTQNIQLREIERQIIDRLQIDLPMVPRPYAQLAASLQISEDQLIEQLQNLKDAKLIVRVGPRFDSMSMGGGEALVALKVPPEQMKRVSALVESIPEIAHCHVREHEYNLWCILMTERLADIDRTVQRICEEPGIQARNFIKLLGFHRNNATPTGASNVWKPDPIDRKLILATQGGLPLVPHPFEEIGRWIGLETADVIQRLRFMREAGVIRCVVAVPNRANLGLAHNALCVWEVPDQDVVRFGLEIATHPFVSRCCQRTSLGEDWPYNLFAIIYGTSREEVRQRAAYLHNEVLGQPERHESLYCTQVLKKRGLRLTMATA